MAKITSKKPEPDQPPVTLLRAPFRSMGSMGERQGTGHYAPVLDVEEREQITAEWETLRQLWYEDIEALKPKEPPQPGFEWFFQRPEQYLQMTLTESRAWLTAHSADWKQVRVWMDVATLVKELHVFPPDARVYFNDGEYGPLGVTRVNDYSGDGDDSFSAVLLDGDTSL